MATPRYVFKPNQERPRYAGDVDWTKVWAWIGGALVGLCFYGMLAGLVAFGLRLLRVI